MSDDTAADDQFIDFECPVCGEPISFPAASAGSLQECFECLTPIILPTTAGMARKIPLPVQTARLVLRKFNAEDWKDLTYLFKNDDFFAAAPFKLEGEEQIPRWLEQDAVIKITTRDFPFILAVESTELKKVVGCVSLQFYDAERLQMRPFVVIHPDYQRRGFGTDALKGVFDFCFNGLLLHRALTYCDKSNEAGVRLLEKSGMRREGEFVRDHKAGKEWSNTLAYAILSNEFKPAPNP